MTQTTAFTIAPGGWLGVACAFDAVFLGAGLLLFSFIYTGDE